MRLAACTICLFALPLWAAAQATPTTAAPPAPSTAPAPAPAADPDPIEDRVIEIVEAPEAPEAVEINGVRRLRVVEGRDGSAYFVDESGEGHDLGDAMGRALEFNPEIRAIRAEIEALLMRLEQLEMKTATDVARKRVEIRQLKDKHTKDKELVEKKAKSPEELAELETEITSREIEMKYLLGSQAIAVTERLVGDQVRLMEFLGRDDVSFALAGGETRPGLESAPDSLRAKLAAKGSLNFSDVGLSEVTAFLTDIYKINFSVDIATRETPVEVNVSDVTIEQALRAIAEAHNLAFIIRDYGIFATTREGALTIPGPSIPEGVPYRRTSATGRRGATGPQEQSDRILDYVEGHRTAPPPPAPEAAPTPKAR